MLSRELMAAQRENAWLRLEVDHARRGERVRPAVGTTSAPGLDDDLMREVHAIHALVDARTAPACASGAMVGERVHAASARMPRTDGIDRTAMASSARANSPSFMTRGIDTGLMSLDNSIWRISGIPQAAATRVRKNARARIVVFVPAPPAARRAAASPVGARLVPPARDDVPPEGGGDPPRTR